MTAITTAVVLATTAAERGGAAAAQVIDGATLLRRLLLQLRSLGVSDVVVLARPASEAELLPSLEGLGGAVRLRVSPTLAHDLRALESLAREAPGGIVVAHGDILTQREALARLLADPRVATAVLAGDGAGLGPYAFPLRTRRGRVLSAASPFHFVRHPTASFGGVLRVAPHHAAALAQAAAVLADTTEPTPPPAWLEELRRKSGGWAQAARDAAAEDAAALLVVALVRRGTPVATVQLREFPWARPLSGEALRSAGERLLEHDEEKLRLDSAVKASDGFFTTFFVSPYSKHIARWAARRGLTPNQVTTASLLLGVLAAAALATGERWGLVTGAVLVQLAFTTDCVDGQLARYTRRFSSLGAWLDSIFDRTKEYVVFAGLAIGASRMGDPVWTLAAAALTLQTVRHTMDLSFQAGHGQAIDSAPQPPLEQPGDDLEPAAPPGAVLRRWHASDDRPAIVWLRKIVAFPIGERFAAISLTAALFDARVTFAVLLAWGGVATSYQFAGRMLRSVSAPARRAGGGVGALLAYRDDGPLAGWIAATPGRALPAPAAALAAAGALPLALAMLLGGGGASGGVAAGAVAWLVLLGGASGARAHDGRLSWTVPPLVRACEYAGIVWLAALAGAGGAIAAAFALLAALAFRHYDLAYRLRHRGVLPATWLSRLAGGWDGRLIVACALLLSGALPAGMYVVAALLAATFVGESVHYWTQVRRGAQPVVYDDEEDDGQ